MITNKPTILIYATEPEEALLEEICAGMEEEGIPFTIVRKEAMDFDSLCLDSANDSVLGAGIGILRSQAALHLRLLPKGKQLFSVINPTLPQARCLGANAARAVKRIPFKEL